MRRIYPNIQIYLSQIFIRTFVRINLFLDAKISFLRILFGHSFVNVLECERYLNIHTIFRIQIFIRTFVCVKCCLQIYADIRSCRKFYECYTLDQMVTETTYYPLLKWRILRFDDNRPLGPLGGQNGQYKV